MTIQAGDRVRLREGVPLGDGEWIQRGDEGVVASVTDVAAAGEVVRRICVRMDDGRDAHVYEWDVSRVVVGPRSAADVAVELYGDLRTAMDTLDRIVALVIEVEDDRRAAQSGPTLSSIPSERWQRVVSEAMMVRRAREDGAKS